MIETEQRTPDLQAILDEVYAALEPRRGEGKVADYIPQLARINPQHFGMAIVTVDGAVYTAGDAELPFSIQSISKVFTLTLALGKHGETLWNRVGREPSGSAFNSIVQLEHEGGKPRNPFINAAPSRSAISSAPAIPRARSSAKSCDFLRYLADDDDISIDPAVARSEAATGFRNAALANFMRAFDKLSSPVDHVLGVYFHHCAIAMSCVQLAKAGLFLANGGKQALTGRTVVSRERARRINALMLTCGHYDGSGDFAYHVGLPGKSGVGGGIMAVAPGRAALAVWSPGLNQNGNSLLGSVALEMIAQRTGWSVFGP